MVREFLCLASLLFLSSTPLIAQNPSVVTTTTSDPATVSLETLFSRADLVAFLKVQSGDSENYEGALYKAVVLKSYKGSKVNDVIYFAPFIGYAVGAEYLVFLMKTQKRISEMVRKDAGKRAAPYDVTQSPYRIMYDGYSVMPVSYECAFEKPSHQSCDYAVKFNTKQVKLSARLKTFPADCEDVDISHVGFVKRKAIEPVLESLRKDDN